MLKIIFALATMQRNPVILFWVIIQSHKWEVQIAMHVFVKRDITRMVCVQHVPQTNIVQRLPRYQWTARITRQHRRGALAKTHVSVNLDTHHNFFCFMLVIFIYFWFFYLFLVLYVLKNNDGVTVHLSTTKK